MPVSPYLRNKRRKEERDNATWKKAQRTSKKQAQAAVTAASSKSPAKVQQAINTIYPSQKQAGHMAKTPKRSSLPAVQRAKESRTTKQAVTKARKLGEKSATRLAEKNKNREKARDYKVTQTNKLVDKAYQKDSEGNVKTKTQRVPVTKPGVTDKDVKKASDKLENRLNEIAKSGAVSSQREMNQLEKVGRTTLAKELFQTTKKGKIKTEPIEVPKLKPKVKPKKVQAKQRKIVKTTKKIRQGKKVKLPERVQRDINERQFFRTQRKQARDTTRQTERAKTVLKERQDEGGLLGDIKDVVSDVVSIPAGLADSDTRAKTPTERAASGYTPPVLEGIKSAALVGGGAIQGAAAAIRGLGMAANNAQLAPPEGSLAPRGKTGKPYRIGDAIANLDDALAAINQGERDIGVMGVGAMEQTPFELFKRTLNEAEHGRGSLHWAMEVFNRAPAVTENLVARTLRELNVGEFKDMDIPRITDAVIKGWNQDGAITGGTFARALDLPEQTGLAFDLGLDPLLYVGAGWASNASALKAAQLEAKLAKSGVDLTKSARYQALKPEVARTGDFDEMYEVLRDIAKQHNVKLGKSPADLKLRRDVRRALTGRGKLAEKLRADDPDFERAVAAIKEQGNRPKEGYVGRRFFKNEQTPYSPENLMELGAKSVLRSAVKNRRRDPVPELRLVTPLGRRVAGVRLPLGKLADIPALPRWTAGASRSADQLKVERELAPIAARINDEIEDLRTKIQNNPSDVEARAVWNRDIRHLQNELAAERNRLTAKYAVQDATDARPTSTKERLQRLLPKKPAGVDRMVSLREALAARDRSRVIHEMNRVVSSAGRAMDVRHQEALRRINIEPDSKEHLRLTIHRMLDEDTGIADELFKDAGIPPITGAEREKLTRLKALHARQGESDVASGALMPEQFRQGYVPRQAHMGGSVFATADHSLAAGIEKPVGGNSVPGATDVQFQKQRAEAGFTALADNTILANAIQELSGQNLNSALRTADTWYEQGLARRYQSDLLRKLQRRGPIPVRELTEADKRAVREDGDEYFQKSYQNKEEYVELRPATGEDAAQGKAAAGVYIDPVSQRDLNPVEADAHRLLSLQHDRAFYENHPVLQGDHPLAAEFREQLQNLEIEAARYRIKRQDALPPKEVRTNLNEALKAQRAAERSVRAAEKEIKKRETAVRVANRTLKKVRKDAKGTRGGKWPKAISSAKKELALAKKELVRAKRARASKKGWAARRSKEAQQAAEIVEKLRPISKEELDSIDWHPFVTLDDATRAQQQFDLDARSADPNVPHLPGTKARNDQPASYTNDIFEKYPDTRQRGLWYDMDPERVALRRNRQSVVKAANIARIRAVDNQYGRSLSEAGSVAFVRDGDEVIRRPADDFVPIYDSQGNLRGYSPRENPSKVYTTDEVSIPNGMIPTAYRVDGEPERWADATTGIEYMRPGDFGHFQTDPLMQAIVDQVPSDRLIPTQVLQDFVHDLQKYGGSGRNAETFDMIFNIGVNNLVQRIMGLMRFGVTTWFPAYHMRNFASDVLKGLQADTGVIFAPRRAAQLVWMAARGGKNKGTFRFPGIDTDLQAEEALFILDIFGVRSAQHIAEYGLIASGQKRPRFGQGKLGLLHPGPRGKGGQKIMEWSARREDMMRFVTFAQRMKRNGGDVGDAAWYMTKHHFDYGDLTSLERGVMRNIFLFYTWYRKNIPLQLMELITRPGFFAGVSSTYAAMERGESPINVDWSKVWHKLPNLEGEADVSLVPDHLRNILSGVTLNWNGHAATFATGTPWMDMNLLFNIPTRPAETSRQFVAMLNPIASTLVNQVYDTDVLTGRGFGQKEPAPWAVEKISELFGMELEEDRYGRPLLNSHLVSLIRQLPFFGRAAAYMTPSTRDETLPDEGVMSGNVAKQIGSFLFGVNLDVSPISAKGTERQYKQELRTIMGKRKSYEDSLDLGTVKHRKAMEKYEYEVMVPEILEKEIPRAIVYRTPGTYLYKTKEEREKAKKKRGSGWTFGSSGSSGSESDWSGGFSSKSKKRSSTGSGWTFGSSGSEPDWSGGFSSKSKKDKKEPKKHRDRPAPHPPDPWENPEAYGINPKNYRVPEPAKDRQKRLERQAPASVRRAAERGTNIVEGIAREIAPPDRKPAKGDNRSVVDTVADAVESLFTEDKAPKPKRQVAKKLVKAVKKSTGGVPDFVPEEYRKHVAKYGPMLDKAVQAEGLDLTGTEYLARLIQFESSWNPDEIGPDIPEGNARHLGQFIPGTRETFLREYGVDAWGSPEEQIKAAAMHASGDYGHDPLYAGYNPGYSDTDPIVEGVRIPEYTLDKPKDIPKPLIKEAKRELGDKAVDLLLEGGKIMKASKAKKQPLVVKELFHDPGINMRDGVETTAIGGHGSHVHFASDDPASILMVAKKAQEMGVLVEGMGENPAFDEMDSQHATGSNHYQQMPMPGGLRRLRKATGVKGEVLGKALDMSGGTAEDRLALNKWIAENAGKDVNVGALGVKIKGTNLMVVPPAPATTAAASAGGTGSTAPSSGGGGGLGPNASDQLGKPRLDLLPHIGRGRGRRGGNYFNTPTPTREEIDEYYGIPSVEREPATPEQAEGRYGLTAADIRKLADLARRL